MRRTARIIAIILITFPVTSFYLFADPIDALGFEALFSSRAWYLNPAFDTFQNNHAVAMGVRLPVGLLGLLKPTNNPMYYFTDPDRFRTEFDFLSFVTALQFPSLLLLNVPRSPDQTWIRISADMIRIEGSGDTTLNLGCISGTQGLSAAGTALVPPPILSLPLRAGPFVLRTILFAGSEGYSLSPDDALKSALESGGFVPQSEYALIARGAASAGVGQSVGILLPVYSDPSRLAVDLGLRVYTFAVLAFADTLLSARITTGDTAIPQTIGYGWRFRLLYPGEGWGAGVRFDAGLSIKGGDWILGLSLLDAIGVRYTSGIQSQTGSAASAPLSPFTEVSYDLLQSMLANVIWSALDTDNFRLDLAAGLRFLDGFGGSLRIMLTRGSVFLVGGVAVRRTASFETAAGLDLGAIRLRGGITWVEEPISGSLLPGLSLHVAMRSSAAEGSR